jgi:hypothetical protein
MTFKTIRLHGFQTAVHPKRTRSREADAILKAFAAFGLYVVLTLAFAYITG